jgi:hypothetical protein
MKVNPPKPDPPASPDPKPAGTADKIPPPRLEKITRARGGDSIEISEPARELAELASSDALDVGTLEPHRIREIIIRISRGGYNNPRVQRELVLHISRDLGLRMYEGE